MPDIVEALHNLARQRGRGDNSPLIALRQLPARPGSRISHLPISQRLAQAWVTVTGAPFHQHQSLALSALRRGEALALVGGTVARQTLHLMGLELLRAEAPATALVLAPDEAAANVHRDALQQLAQALGEPLRASLAFGSEARTAMGAQLVVATPAVLHDRMLRHHERAWALFWSRLRLVQVADVQRYSGVAATHLAELLLRARRLATGERSPQLAVTVGHVAGIQQGLELLAAEPWRIIAADDAGSPASALALWRLGGERVRETAALAIGLARAGASVHVSCAPYEAPILQALLGSDEAAISVGASPLPAQVQLFVGAAGAAAGLRQALDNAQLGVLLLGDDPAERTLARLASRDPEQLPILDGLPAWVAAPGNAYVTAQHLVCAASERPIDAAEVAAWQVESIVSRLEQQGQLVQLPGSEAAWQPVASDDPYADFDLRAAGGAPAVLRSDNNGPLGQLATAEADRWAFLGASLPPMRGGYRVVARDDEALELTLRTAPEARRTLPLRRCAVRVRDRREQRTLRGREVGWGRVVVDEEVYGYREVSAGSAPADRVLNPPLTASWSAPAVWVDLSATVSGSGQLAGWSLAAALTLHTTGELSELVPAYDVEARRIYFVDAQPGGNGLAAWLFAELEQILPLAYDIALDCRGDPLLDALARADMDWLLSLLGGSVGALAQREVEDKRPAEPQLLELPLRRVEAPRVEPAREEPPRVEPPRVVPLRPEPAREEPRRVEPPRVVPVREEPRRVEPAREEPRVEPPRVEPPRVEPPRVEPAREEPRVEPPLLPAERAPSRPERAERAAPTGRGKRRSERETPRSSAERRGSPPAPARPEPARPSAPVQRGRGPGRSEPPAAASTRQEKPPPPPRTVPEGPPLRQEPPLAAQPPRRVQPPPEPEPSPDPAAMVARLRRLREQRERQDDELAPAQRGALPASGPVEPRFHAGNRIFCMPYGEGEVVASRVQGDTELLVVAFPDHGELTIDPSVSAVRLLDKQPWADDDPPF